MTCVVLIYLLRSSIDLVMQMVTTGRTTNILRIPQQFVYGAFPAGCVLMIINYTYSMYHSHLKRKDAEKEEEV